MEKYKDRAGQEVTLEGKTCGVCDRRVSNTRNVAGVFISTHRCHLSGVRVTPVMVACSLFPLVNGWQTQEPPSSHPSNE